MSRIFNLILCYSCLETDNTIDRVNEFWKEDIDEGHEKGLVLCNDESVIQKGGAHPCGDFGHWYGGTKNIADGIAIGCYNYVNVHSLMEHLNSLNWQDPESVYLMVNDEYDEGEWKMLKLKK